MEGKTVAHYQVLEKLGGGGMGIVYRARDTKLNRFVALKFLPPHLSSDETSKARFIQEAQAASALEDDNICTIYEIGETADGQLYISMALYEGLTLKDLMERHGGPMPVAESVSIAAQIAEGLHRAHGHGIVHRDIKPANIMITDRGKVKILDFGLAKLGMSADLTNDGSTVGTTSYMSPEQARGDDVGPASDVWSLGVVLYEMLTGVKPFRGDYEQAVVYGILNQNPDDVQVRRDDAPAELSRLVMRSLAKDPSDRWVLDGNGIRVLQGLRGMPEGLHTSLNRPAGQGRPTWRHTPWKIAAGFVAVSALVLVVVYAGMIALGLPDWVLLVAGLLLLAGLPIMLIAGLTERKRFEGDSATQRGVQRILTVRNAIRGGGLAFGALAISVAGFGISRVIGVGPAATLVSSGALEETDVLILADFRNHTADSTLGQSVTELIRIDLNQSPVIRLMQPPEIASALERMSETDPSTVTLSIAREIGLREGAKAVVIGDISSIGRSFALTAELVSADDGETLVALRETADSDGEIIQAVDRLSADLREQIGESLRTIRANPPLEQVSTASLAALRKYTLAESAADAGDFERAIALLEEAIEEDSLFAMAYRKLAVNLGNTLGDFEYRVRAQTRVFELRERLPDIERYHAEASYYWQVAIQLDDAINAYRSILEIDPDDQAALNNLAKILVDRGETEAGLTLALRAVEAADIWQPYFIGIQAYDALGDTSSARRLVELYEERVGENVHAARLRVMFAEVRRDFAEAEEYARIMLARDSGPFWRGLNAAWAYAGSVRQGLLGQAEQALEQYVGVSLERGLPHWALILEADRSMVDSRLLDRRDLARRRLKTALATYPLDAMPADNRPYGTVATAFALAGDLQAARVLLDEAEHVWPAAWLKADSRVQEARGTIAMAEARYDEAVGYFQAMNAADGCNTCLTYHLAVAQQAAGDEDEALATLEAYLRSGGAFALWHDRQTLGPSFLMAAEIYESRGDNDRAIENYTRLIDLWKNADPEFQPFVDQARGRLDFLIERQVQEPSS